MYPGGNEVNVAVHATRHGLDSSYVGWVGNDLYGELITSSLEEEGVDLSHCQVRDDVNTYTEIFHENGDRRFGNVRRGASSKAVLIESDLEFIKGHDLLFTSYYSRMEQFIKTKPDNLLVAFDFTELADEKYLSEHLPHVDIAIIPIETSVDDIKGLLKSYYNMGAELLLVTMGSHGAYSYDGNMYYQPAMKGDVVDTLGAGDAFIARFIVEYLAGTPLESAMSAATKSAYECCMHFGAFGYGIAIPEE